MERAVNRAEPTSLAAAYRARFGGEPQLVVRSPGRVNLIGDHTDYTGGLVLPIALDGGLFIVAGCRADAVVDIQSTSFPEPATIPLDDPAGASAPGWAHLALGVIVGLQRRGILLKGAQLYIDGYLECGAGLASSAATAAGVALALTALVDVEVDRFALARLCQRAEHEFAGAPCGLMDQINCLFARRGYAMLLDCRSLEQRFLPYDWSRSRREPLPPNKAVMMVINSRVKHSIAGGEYAQRRRDCDEALRLIRDRAPAMVSLRDVAMNELSWCERWLPPILFRRLRHVVTENARVLAAADALSKNDACSFGRLMTESHLSLRDDFEVSCRALDLIVDYLSNVEGVYGARLTGGGFGGCIIALMEETAIEAATGRLGDLGHAEGVWGTTGFGDSCDAAGVIRLTSDEK